MLKLIKFLLPYKGRVTAMLILLFLQVLGTLYIPTLTADIVNNGIVAGDLDHIWKIGGFMLAVAILITNTQLRSSLYPSQDNHKEVVTTWEISRTGLGGIRQANW